jgi:hypothetical protein
MAESKDAFKRLDAMAESVAELKRSVAAITRSKTHVAEVVDDLVGVNGSLARVYMVVTSAMTQEEISEAYAAKWGSSISAGGLSGKLKELAAMDLVVPSSVRVSGKLIYSRTGYSSDLNMSRQLETRVRQVDRGNR